jgi:hypothetical protein
VQALHSGPYETEPETIAAMDTLDGAKQLTMNGAPPRDLPNGRDRAASATRDQDHPPPSSAAARSITRRARRPQESGSTSAEDGEGSVRFKQAQPRRPPA